MFILGINAFHGDSSACLIKDGVLISAAEEERFRRIKHWAGFPSKAVSWCLSDAGISLEDVQHIAINQSAKASLVKKFLYVLFERPNFKILLNSFRNKRKRLNVK